MRLVDRSYGVVLPRLAFMMLGWVMTKGSMKADSGGKIRSRCFGEVGIHSKPHPRMYDIWVGWYGKLDWCRLGICFGIHVEIFTLWSMEVAVYRVQT
jgi:hypothetical protein